MDASEFHKEWRKKNPIASWMKFAEAYNKYKINRVEEKDIRNIAFEDHEYDLSTEQIIIDSINKYKSRNL